MQPELQPKHGLTAWLCLHPVQIGLVSQEPLLFSCSILDNIRFGRPDASMEEVEAAARAANAHDFILNQPDGYNTQVGGRHGIQVAGRPAGAAASPVNM